MQVGIDLGDAPPEVVLGDEVDGEVELVELDVSVGARGREEGALDLAAGHVGGVDDPVRRVPALAPEVEVAVGRAVEVGAEPHQLADPLRPFGDDDPHDLLVAQPGPGDERVADVVLEGVGRGHHRRDPALRVVRVRLGRRLFRDDGDRAVLGGAEGEREPGDAAADDEEIEAFSHWFDGAIYAEAVLDTARSHIADSGCAPPDVPEVRPQSTGRK